MIKTAITLFPAFISLFWMMYFLLEKREHKGIKLIMSVFFFITTLLYFSHALYFNHQYSLYVCFDAVYTFSTIAVYPLYFIYIIHLTREPHLKATYFLLLLPAFLMGILTAVSYLMISEEEVGCILKYVIYSHDDNISLEGWSRFLQLKREITGIIFFVQIIPVIVIGIKLIISFDKKIRDFYSNIENKTVISTRNLYYVFTFFSLFSVIANIVGRNFFSSTLSLIFPSLIFGTLLYLVGFYSSRQHFTVRDLHTDNPPEEDKNSSSVTKHTLLNGTEQKLLELYEKEKIYIHPDLNLIDISSKLNTNRTYISRIINQQFGLSFCDFTNKYRIEEACRILSDPELQNLGMKEVSVRSGFTGESSFYRIFKREKGIAPGEWRKHAGKTNSFEINHHNPR
jgi:AraC-like DNA-binding protein